MKKSDVIALGVAASVLGFFAFVPGALDTFKLLSKQHGYLMSAVKFGVLATFGECLALRLQAGVYNRRGFGVVPKFVVWALLGMVIKAAFVTFATGAPHVVASLGFNLAGAGTAMKIVTAFAISVTANTFFAPLMMVAHKVTDTHIHQTGGTLRGALSSVDVGKILKKLDWDTMWNFVFKKTIPFFWYPAHTITFLLPPEFQILSAALLGLLLGVILAYAGNRKQPTAAGGA